MIYIKQGGYMKSITWILLIWGLCYCLSAQVVECVADVPFQPSHISNTVKTGDSQGLLHFYRAYITTDSIGINTFTCDQEGIFSESSTLYRYQLQGTQQEQPVMLLFKHINQKLFFHVQTDSTTLLCVSISDDGIVTENMINTDGKRLRSSSENYVLLNDDTIITSTDTPITILGINIPTGTITQITSDPGTFDYIFRPLSSDYCLAYCIGTMSNSCLLVDSNFRVITVEHDIVSYYNPIAQFGDYYYVHVDAIVFDFYGGIISIVNNSIHLDSYDFVDYNIVKLSDNQYVCIEEPASYSAIRSIPYFATHKIQNGQFTNNNEFPQLSTFENPVVLKRIDSRFLLSISSPQESIRLFTVSDLDNQVYSTTSYSLTGLNSASYFISGDYIYAPCSDRMYVFHFNRVLNSPDQNATPIVDNVACYPNPFSTQMNIQLRVSQPTKVSVSIYDTKGRKVRNLWDNKRVDKENTLQWDGKNDRGQRSAAGIYFVKTQTGSQCLVKKVVVLHQ